MKGFFNRSSIFMAAIAKDHFKHCYASKFHDNNNAILLSIRVFFYLIKNSLTCLSHRSSDRIWPFEERTAPVFRISLAAPSTV